MDQTETGLRKSSPRFVSDSPWNSPGTNPPGSDGGMPPTYFGLSKLTPEDDVEAYLYSFEATATAVRWPHSQWVTILGLYLTGPAQEATDYQKVKAAIL